MNTCGRMLPVHFIKLMSLSMIGFILFSIGLQIAPAQAKMPGEPSPEGTTEERAKASRCFSQLQGTISSTPQTVDLWQTATLSWNVTGPGICTEVDFSLQVDSQDVFSTGSRSIQPIADRSYKLYAKLPAAFGGKQRTLATVAVKVNLPKRPDRVTISTNDLEPLFLQALRTENTDIFVRTMLN